MTIKKYLLLIWDTKSNKEVPPLMMAFTSDNENDLNIAKGELADNIEKTLDIKIDVGEFDSEIISYNSFIKEYSNKKNPNKVILKNIYSL